MGAGLAGLGIGAILGSALAPPAVYVAPPPPPPVYYGWPYGYYAYGYRPYGYYYGYGYRACLLSLLGPQQGAPAEAGAHLSVPARPAHGAM